ncbi:uncharacterized protein LOC142895120 isoform X2 [Nelusetta ayraudi]|uniref:uncharacterized protein LOC142895120 isoform X2 n=1 Tax=Nelusetta ayraudi TaxID=303726 RepID=UPI003F70C7ED
MNCCSQCLIGGNRNFSGSLISFVTSSSCRRKRAREGEARTSVLSLVRAHRSTMATHDDDIPVSFLCATDTAIYFEVTVTGLAEDSFTISNGLTMKIFKSRDMFLTVKDTQLQTSDEFDKFCIQPYRCSETNKSGKAVMLFVNQEDVKKKVVFCKDRREVSLDNLEIPKDIEGNEHKAIFYLTPISSVKYMFESSLYRSHYLGFDDNGGEDHETLILRHKAEDEVDERCNIELEEC